VHERLIVAGTALAFSFLGVACGDLTRLVDGFDPNELSPAAHSLVPSTGRVVHEKAADCVELISSPSCVFLEIAWARRHSRADRAQAVTDKAAASGWRLLRDERLPGGRILTFERGGLRAWVYLEPRGDQARDRISVEATG
jgi:hypothetical protein